MGLDFASDGTAYSGITNSDDPTNNPLSKEIALKISFNMMSPIHPRILKGGRPLTLI